MTGFHSCCGFPHGQASIFALVLGVSSYFLAISSSWGCYFATVDFILIDDSPAQMQNFGGMGMGLFSYEDKTAPADLTCKAYSNEQIDSFDVPFRAARTSGIIANILIGTGMICLMSLSCIVVRKSVLKAIGYILVLGGVMQAFTLLFFKSNAICYDCEFYFGAGLSLLCMVVTIVNSVVSCNIEEAYLEDEDIGSLEGSVNTTKSQINVRPMSPPHEISIAVSSTDSEDDRSTWNNPATPMNNEENRPRRKKRRQIVTTTIVNQDGTRTIEEKTFSRNKDGNSNSYR